MLQHRSNTQKQALHFKKWSRKGYAVFLSIGREVSIGRLSIGISQWIGQVILHLDSILLQLSQQQEEDDNMLKPEDELVLEWLPVNATDTVCAFVNNNNINRRNWGLFPGCGFFMPYD